MKENYYDEVLPQLVPLDRKNTQDIQKQSTSKNMQEAMRSKITEQRTIKNPTNENINTNNKELTSLKNQQFTQLIQNRNEEAKKKRQQNQLKKKNELSKSLIAEMVNKLSMKNISQEIYPVSNETVNRLILDINKQIDELTLEIQKRQNSLLMNPNNQHLKKELQTIEKTLNQVKTIKDLYGEKIDYRNKISELQSRIIDLKSQNRDLKIKIGRGIQKIESHIHNLPCEKQKQLIEQVNKYKLALNIQKQMRQNLEINISNIVLNFKRFYVEADEARKIVTEQLKQIAKKEGQLKSKIQNFELKNKSKAHTNDAGSVNLTSQGLKPQNDNNFLRQRSNTNNFGDNNHFDLLNTKRTKTNDFEAYLKTKKQQGALDPSEVLSHEKGFSLEQQIERMRNNQLRFSKNSAQRTKTKHN